MWTLARARRRHRRALRLWLAGHRARFGPDHVEARLCRRALAVVERRQAGG